MNKRIRKKKAHALYNKERKFMYLFRHRLTPYSEETANTYMGLYLKKNYGAKTYTSDEVRMICDYIRSAVYKAALMIDFEKAIEVISNEV